MNKALINVAKECPKEVALVMILGAHQLVKAFFTKSLQEDLFSGDTESFGLEIVLLVKIRRVATVNSI